MEQPGRELTDEELLVLSEIQTYWGSQNTADDVFFTDRGNAAMFVRARDGKSYIAVDLTNLGQWHADETLSTDELRDWIKGDAPDA